MKQYCETENHEFKSNDENTCLWIENYGENGILKQFLYIGERDDAIGCMTSFPFNVPPNRQSEMAEFICRANAGMDRWYLTMHHEDGEVVLVTTSFIAKGVLPDNVIEHTVLGSACIADSYFPSLMLVICGTAAKDAVEALNAQRGDDPPQAVAETAGVAGAHQSEAA